MKITHYKLSKKTQLKLLEFFVAEVVARTSADLLGIHANTAILFYHKIRLVIEYHLVQESNQLFDGEIELDESYFGGVCKGKRGRGAGGKTAVFGLLKRNGRVCVVVVKDTKTKTLMPIITSKIKPDSIFIPTATKVATLLMWVILGILELIIPKNLPKDHNHIKAQENFWNQAKRVLRKYNGINKKHFHLFIKECEFRFNYGTPSQKLKTLRKWCGV